MNDKKISNLPILAVFGIAMLIIVAGCVSPNKENENKTSDVSQTGQVTPEQETIVTPVTQETPASGISSSTGDMIERYSLEKLASMSDSVVIGEVTNVLPSKWNTPDGNKPLNNDIPYVIYTDANIKIGEYLKGILSTKTITVRVLGGTVGQDRQDVEDQPSYVANEKVLIFLKKDNDSRTKDIGGEHLTTVGLVQGKISISQNNDIFIGDEKISLDNAKVRIIGKG